MKTIVTILFFVSISVTSYPQVSQYNPANEKQKTDQEFPSNAVTYRLFPTQNMWTFIKLNTRNGKMWQVSYDIQGDNRYEVYLSLVTLVTLENEANNRFTLYPTQNMYNFLLLDQHDGRTWQVQWSMEAKNRGIIPIE